MRQFFHLKIKYEFPSLPSPSSVLPSVIFSRISHYSCTLSSHQFLQTHLRPFLLFPSFLTSSHWALLFLLTVLSFLFLSQYSESNKGNWRLPPPPCHFLLVYGSIGHSCNERKRGLCCYRQPLYWPAKMVGFAKGNLQHSVICQWSYLTVHRQPIIFLTIKMQTNLHCYKDWRDFPLPRPGAADSFRT
jgi:hypothetical protein